MFHNYVACRAIVATVVGCAPDKWGAGLFPQIFVPVFIARRAPPRALSHSLLSKAPGLVDYILLNTAFVITAWDMMTDFSPRNLMASIEGTSCLFVCDIRMILSALDKMIRQPAGPDLVVFIIGAL